MPDEHGRETDDEARERVRQVLASQIFGDFPAPTAEGFVTTPEEVEEAFEDEEVEAEEEPSAEEPEDEPEEEADEHHTAAEVIADIEAAESVEEVDALAEGDDRVTVQRAADKRREELAE